MTPRRNSGFTLIEVLIAFAILAVVMGVVYGAVSSGLRQERVAEDTTARVLEARSILEAVGVEGAVEAGTITGETAAGDPWTLTIAEVPVRPESDEIRSGARLWHAVVTIEGDDGRALTLEALKPGTPPE